MVLTDLSSDLTRLLAIEKGLASRVQPLTPEKQAIEQNLSVTRRQGTVSAIDWTNGRCSVTIGGIDVPNIAFRRYVTAKVGDVVWVELAGGDPHIVGMLGWPTWVNITLLAGTTNVGSPYNPLSYAPMPGGYAMVRGTVKLGSAGVGAVIGNIPDPFRPKNQHVFRCVQYTGAAFSLGVYELFVNGDIKATVGTNSQFFYMDTGVYSLFV